MSEHTLNVPPVLLEKTEGGAINNDVPKFLVGLPPRETLPFDQLASFAASGSVQGMLGTVGWLALAIGLTVISGTVLRRLFDRNLVAPYLRHKEGYFDGD